MQHFNAQAPRHLQEPSRSRRPQRKTSDLQEKILAAVQQEPGSTQTDLATAVDRPINTVRKNLYTLVHRELLAKRKQGRYILYYPSKDNILAPGPHLRVLLRDDRKKRIINALSTHGDHSTIHALATHLNEDYGFVKRTVETLAQLGYVRLEPEKHRRRIILLPKLIYLPGMTNAELLSAGMKSTDGPNSNPLRATDPPHALRPDDTRLPFREP